VLAYMLTLRSQDEGEGSPGWRYTLADALAILTRARPCICINPGFLAQLYLLAQDGPAGRGTAARVRLLQQTERRVRGGTPVQPSPVLPARATRGVRCGACKQQLCAEEDVLREEDERLADFVAASTDGFWAGYPPSFASQSKKKKPKAKSSGSLNVGVAKVSAAEVAEVLCCWLPWMARQTSSDTSSPLRCPQCSAEVGSVKHTSLPIAGSFACADRISIFSK